MQKKYKLIQGKALQTRNKCYNVLKNSKQQRREKMQNNCETLKTQIPMYQLSLGEATLHVTKGNSKLGKGIYTFSTLPGNERHMLYVHNNQLLTDVCGTCSKHCENCFNGGCYAVGSAQQYHNTVIPAWGENTLLLRAGKIFDLLDQFLTKKNKRAAVVKQFRINVSGEIQDVAELESWDQLTAKHPEVTFGVYTKNYEALGEFLDRHQDTQPNFVVNVSQWHGAADEFLQKYPGRCNVFEYDDSFQKGNQLSDEDKARLASMPHCIAVTKQGKHAKRSDGTDITCDSCGKCYRKTRTTTAVYAH